MKIAILGGTGKLGLAFAQRLIAKTEHEAAIGSRDAVKAIEAARSLDRVQGLTNADAARWCDAAFVSVPYAGHRSLLVPLRDALDGKIIIDATVPLDPQNLVQVKTDSGSSAAEETGSFIPGADVLAAFHTISHRILRQPDVPHDVLVAGTKRKSVVLELIRALGLRPIDAGSIEVAGHLERMTALLLSINKANKVKESGIKITGI
jgi:8-hydroxy-5-deazaflavin:NADPH oxidoreductase